MGKITLPEDVEDNAPMEESPQEVVYSTGGGGHSVVREATGKYHVNGVDVRILNERVQYYGENGQLITQSLKDYTRDNVKKSYASLDEFLNVWNEGDQRQIILKEMEEKGILFDALQKKVGKEFSPFDLICHVAFDQPPLTRRERANNVKKRNYFVQYGEQAREVLNALLDK